MAKTTKPRCVGCGCTERRACVGGCSWHQLVPPVCSRCAMSGDHLPFQVFGTHVVGPGPDPTVTLERATRAEAEDLAVVLNGVWATALSVGMNRITLPGELLSRRHDHAERQQRVWDRAREQQEQEASRAATASVAVPARRNRRRAAG